MNKTAVAARCALDLSRLYDHQEASSFSDVVDDLDGRAKSSLFTDRRFRPLQEALILRDFALTLGHTHCRLCPPKQQFPDGEVSGPNGIVKVEITEVMEAGRHRDAEYKELERADRARVAAHIEQRQLRTNGELWPKWVLEAVHDKTKYGPGIAYDIIVYNNVHVFSLPQLPQVARAVQGLMSSRAFDTHRVWHYQTTVLHQLHPKFEAFRIPGARSRF